MSIVIGRSVAETEFSLDLHGMDLRNGRHV